MNIRNSRAGPMAAKQRGIVLFVSLALLMAIAVGGIAAAQVATLELRMVRNHRDAAMAFQAADAALGEAEAWLETTADDPSPLFAANSGGLFLAPGYGEEPRWQRAGAWTSGDSRSVVTALPNVAQPPRYIVEWLSTRVEPAVGGAPPVTIDLFRITARGTGVSASAILQSTYGRARGGAAHGMAGRLSWTDLGA